MAITCPAVEVLFDFIEGVLPRPQAVALQEHLATCSSCHSSVQDLLDHQDSTGDDRGDGERAELTEPPTIEGYQILGEIHRGGQGVVFAARQVSTRRQVAIKVLLQGPYATRRQRLRFEREIDLAARLNHPNIVTVFDSGRTAARSHYFVMEYVDGKPLQQYLTDATPSLRERIVLMRRICDTVHFAHQRGVIHRDLKPGNILLDREGQPHVLDFGLAKQRARSPEDALATQSGEFTGTLPYASPEQVQGIPDAVDVRSDIYSVGVLLYETLTGSSPYPTRGPLAEIVEHITRTQPTSPSTLCPEIDHDLAAVMEKTLRKEREHRYQSLADLSSDLGRYLAGEAVEALAGSRWYMIRKRLHRHRVAAAVAVIVAASLVSATAISTVFWRRSEQDRQRFEIQRDRAVEAEAVSRQRGERLAVEAAKLRENRDFLVSILASADPYVGGRDLKVVSLLEDAARRLETELGDPEIRAEVELTLGKSYHGLGMLADAEAWYRKALAHSRDLLGPDDGQSLDSQVFLADVLLRTDRPAEAERLLDDALERCRRVLGDDDRRTLDTRNEVARLRHEQGRLEDAEVIYRDLLDRSRRALGEDDPDTILAGHNLAVFLLTIRQYDEAEPLLREATRRSRVVLDEHHPSTLAIENALGQLLVEQKSFDAAEELLRQSLDRRRAVLGDRHPAVFRALSNLGLCLLQRGDLSAAAPVLQEAVDLGRATLPADHRDLLSVRRNLSGLWWNQGRREAAVDELTRVRSLAEERHGADHPISLSISIDLAMLLRETGEVEAAAEMLRDLIVLGGEVEVPFPNFLPRAHLALGVCALTLGELAEAEVCLLEAYEVFDSTLGPADALTGAARTRLVELYERLGEKNLAAEYRR